MLVLAGAGSVLAEVIFGLIGLDFAHTAAVVGDLWPCGSDCC